MRFEHRVAVIDDSGNEVGTMPIDEFTKIASGFERYIPIVGPAGGAASVMEATPKMNGSAAPRKRGKRGPQKGQICAGSKTMRLYEALDKSPTLTHGAIRRATGLTVGGLASTLHRGRMLGNLIERDGRVTITDKGRSALAAAQGRLQ